MFSGIKAVGEPSLENGDQAVQPFSLFMKLPDDSVKIHRSAPIMRRTRKPI
jgi:hypothetical protein